FRVATYGSVMIHLQLADEAGNVGDAQAEIRAKAGSSSPPTSTVVPAALQSNASAPLAPTAGPARAVSSSGPSTLPSPPATPGAVGSNPTSAVSPPGSWDSSPPVQPVAPRRNDSPSTPERPWASTSISTYQQAGGTGFEPGHRYGQAVVNT